MFIFFDIEYLCLLRDTKQLSSIIDDGFKIYVPHLQINSYSNSFRDKIKNCENSDLIEMLDCDGFSVFLNENELNKSFFGKGFLFLLHCCKIKSLTLVIDETKNTHIALCKKIGVSTITIEEFNKEVIKNELYYKFLMNNKDKIMI